MKFSSSIMDARHYRGQAAQVRRWRMAFSVMPRKSALLTIARDCDDIGDDMENGALEV